MSKKVAVVTGAAQGIGKGIALRLAEAGMNIVVMDINIDVAEKTAQEIAEKYSVECAAYRVDISNTQVVQDAFKNVYERFGNVDVLVNNAGIGAKKKDIAEMTDVDWDRVFNINFKGTINCISAVLPTMRELRCGRIINIASLSGQQGVMAVSLAYGASKAAIINLTKSLAKQMGVYNINVNAVAPGLIETDMTTEYGYRPDMVPLGRLGTPRDVAGAVAFLAGEDGSYVSGAVIDVNGACYVH